MNATLAKAVSLWLAVAALLMAMIATSHPDGRLSPAGWAALVGIVLVSIGAFANTVWYITYRFSHADGVVGEEVAANLYKEAGIKP